MEKNLEDKRKCLSPYLDFNGVDVVAKEVFKRKILLFGDLSKGLSPFCLALFHFLSDTTNI